MCGDKEQAARRVEEFLRECHSTPEGLAAPRRPIDFR